MAFLGLVDVPVWMLMVPAILFLLYRLATQRSRVFPEMGVSGPRPLPIFGNLHEIILKGFLPANNGWFKKYGRVFGIHEGCHPLLMVGDVDMLREITVKEFNNFPNRRNFNSEKVSEPPLTEFLTVLKDDDWRHNRNTLTPTFSGGKLRRMADCIVDAASTLTENLKAKADSGEPIDMKMFTGAYTMDVIAASAFGIKLDTQATPDDPFIKQGRKFFDFSALSPVVVVLFFFPSLMPLLKLFRVSIFPKEAIDFFSNIVKQALQERRQNPSKYTDFLQLMINAERQAQNASDVVHSNGAVDGSETNLGHWVDKRKDKGLTDSEILAASILFFTAGYETTATTLSHALYHLSVNPKIMDRLIAEIDQHFPQGKVPDYENIGKLPYLDMVVMETLRINPPIGRMDRICSKDTTVGGINIPAGMGVALPIYMIHHDPGYWPEPEVFDPERFTPEKREHHHPLQWIPFGYGPRNCIGMRLALFEMKIFLVKVFQKYRLSTNSKTTPLKFGDNALLSPKGGVWLTVENRA